MQAVVNVRCFYGGLLFVAPLQVQTEENKSLEHQIGDGMTGLSWTITGNYRSFASCKKNCTPDQRVNVQPSSDTASITTTSNFPLAASGAIWAIQLPYTLMGAGNRVNFILHTRKDLEREKAEGHSCR
jgi:hypothetical protein